MDFTLPFITADLTMTIAPFHENFGGPAIPGTALVAITSRALSADVTGDDLHIVQRAFMTWPGGWRARLYNTRAQLFQHLAKVGEPEWSRAMDGVNAPDFATLAEAEAYLRANAAQIIADMQARMAATQSHVHQALADLRATDPYIAAANDLAAARDIIGTVSPNRWTGDDLRAAREKLAMTQAELAGELGCVRETIVRYESGSAVIPKSRVRALRAMIEAASRRSSPTLPS